MPHTNAARPSPETTVWDLDRVDQRTASHDREMTVSALNDFADTLHSLRYSECTADNALEHILDLARSGGGPARQQITAAGIHPVRVTDHDRKVAIVALTVFADRLVSEHILDFSSPARMVRSIVGAARRDASWAR